MANPSFEGGLRPQRIEWYRETTSGSHDTDPAYNVYSDTVHGFQPAIDPGVTGRRGLGDADYAHSKVSIENSTLTVRYDLQQWLVNGGGSALDAAYDGIVRDSDNRLPNTHSVVARMIQSDLEASNTVNGSTSKDTRQYFVGVGGTITDVTVALEPGENPTWVVELTYRFKKARRFQIDQPGSSTTLDVVSSDASDTSQSVTIEDEGAGTSESVSLNGTTAATTTASFSDIDAIWIDTETVGDVTVSENGGDDLCVIEGQNSYDHDEGDQGVPLLGAGSHASALGTDYQVAFDGDTITRGGSAIAQTVGTHEVTVENNVSAGEPGTTPFPDLAASDREVTVASTIWGETERYQHTVSLLTSEASDYVWTPASGDTLTFGNVKVLSVDGEENVGEGRMEIDVEFGQQESVTVA